MRRLDHADGSCRANTMIEMISLVMLSCHKVVRLCGLSDHRLLFNGRVGTVLDEQCAAGCVAVDLPATASAPAEVITVDVTNIRPASERELL